VSASRYSVEHVPESTVLHDSVVEVSTTTGSTPEPDACPPVRFGAAFFLP
jgi:hypothetical protein